MPASRILFADEDVVLCVSARRALQNAGYSVTLAHDGADAIGRFDQEPIDIVVAGVALPIKDGFQVLHEIKQRGKDTPVILFGDALPGQSARAENEGAFVYLPTRLSDFDDLISSIARAVTLLEENQPAEPKADSTQTAAPPPSDDARLIVALRELIESVSVVAVPDTIRLMLKASAQAMGTEYAVFLQSEGETGLKMNDALGYADQDTAARDFVQRVGDTFAWRVATERKTMIDHAVVSEGEAALGFIGTPLVAHNELAGVLVAYPLAGEPVRPAQVAWLELFAAQGALAVRLSQLEVENERLSPNDPLTGILKAKVFLDLADHEFRRSWRYSQPIGAILVDIDRMEDINSTSGREFGDQVLRHVANVCRQTVRSIDLVGRYEEDSFALLLLMTDRDAAKSTAERLRAEIGSIDLRDTRGRVRISATLGVCTYPRESCASIFDLLNLTREAQSAARRSGSNQIVYV